MEPSKREQSRVNEGGTGSPADAGLTQRFELIGKDGRAYGQFWTASAAAAHARDMWPDEEQDEDRSGRGWDIQAVGADRSVQACEGPEDRNDGIS